MKGRFIQAARCTCTGGAAWSFATALGAAIAIGTTAAPAPGQTAPLEYDIAPISVDSGVVSFDGKGEEAKAIFSEVVASPGAYWTRLEFGIVQLSGDQRQGNDSYLKLTSLLDGGEQYLDATSIQQWKYNSAYFNGHAVLVELYAHPGTGDNRVMVSGKWIGTEPVQGPIETQCGPSDDRTLSNDARVGRHLPEGCTAWLVNGGAGTNPTCFLSAGHCDYNDSSGDTIEFNVPLSNANGSINFAHPDDQYPVDEASVQESTGYGNDWAFFGCFQNANTGLFPGQAQGTSGFNLVGSVPASAAIQMWGYGLDFDTPTRSQVQQFESDGNYTLTATNVRYNALDTEGGNSGSPIYRPNSGASIGIHTNGGCTTAGTGNNSGTRIDVPALQAALANPQGICVFASSDCPGAGNCFFSNGSPGCNNTDCCNAVCAIDPFCCDTTWDSFCASDALEFCADPACPGTGSCYTNTGTPGCADEVCCNAVCSIDPFCCDTSWDTLCAGAAAAICGVCGAPDAGNCFVSNGTPGCENIGCCSQVCLIDSFCCEQIWDSACASQAIDLCGSTACPSAGNCFVPHTTPGCEDAFCCLNVCLIDGFCCETEWDGLCADEALNICGIDACPGAGTCFQANGTPGCQDETCCNAVCSVDPFCCNVEWDGACASGALAICAGNPLCPSDGSCFFPHGGLGCQDDACCNIVCEIDAFCCATVWDGLCVQEALELCEGAPCALQCPAGAIFEPEPCGEDTNGGCNSEPPVFTPAVCGDVFCGTSWADGSRDTDWYLVEHGGGVFSATLISQFPGVCFIVDGIGTCDPVVVGAIGCSENCDPIADAGANLPPGTYAVFVAPGTCAGGAIFDGYPCDSGFNNYVVEINCTPPLTCPCDFDNDGDVDVDDLLFLLGNWGGPGADCNGDGVTNVDDLLALLGQWGPCP